MPSGVWVLGPSPEPASPGLGGPREARLATLGRCVPGECTPPTRAPFSGELRLSAGPCSSSSYSDRGGRPSAAPSPRSSRLNLGLPKILCARKSRFRDSAVGRLPLPSLLPATFGGRHKGGAWGVRQRHPSQPVLHSSKSRAH